MAQCSIYDNSLRFSRGIYGILALLAYLFRSQWFVLIIGILLLLGAFSIKLNIPYQFHAVILRKLPQEKSEPIQRDLAELDFSFVMTAVLFFIGFFLLYSGFIGFAWIFILIVSLLIFLACFAGVCVASLMYAVFKKAFKKS